MDGRLILKDKTTLSGTSFGARASIAGEIVFATGMVGYPEAITDPSFAGQILVMTYPLIGNYGVPEKTKWESEKIQISGLIVSTYNETPSHMSSVQSLQQWLMKENIPGLEIRDTRFLTKKIRTEGAMLGKIEFDHEVPFHDPNQDNLVAQVSTKKIAIEGSGKKTIVLIDCGTKRNIQRSLLNRNVRLITVPWNINPLTLKDKIDGVVISNGPGDPTMIPDTVGNVRNLLKKRVPILGICLGNQILALAAGGTTEKLRFGHRGQNQPCILGDSKRCYLTTQNHGFVVKKIPLGFVEWFTNANDQTNEGLMHQRFPFMSVQFHPEATPGPIDTEWIFDYFLKKI